MYFPNYFSQQEEADESLKPKTAPIFVSKPESIEVEEGEWARFCCRVTGHPKPRVMWLINGHTVVNVSFLNCFHSFYDNQINILFYSSQGQRYKLNYDGMYHFDVPKTRQYDTGKIEVIARSSIGEALATAELKVVSRRDDYRGVLKNSPRRKYNTGTNYSYIQTGYYEQNCIENFKDAFHTIGR